MKMAYYLLMPQKSNPSVIFPKLYIPELVVHFGTYHYTRSLYYAPTVKVKVVDFILSKLMLNLRHCRRAGSLQIRLQ